MGEKSVLAVESRAAVPETIIAAEDLSASVAAVVAELQLDLAGLWGGAVRRGTTITGDSLLIGTPASLPRLRNLLLPLAELGT